MQTIQNGRSTAATFSLASATITASDCSVRHHRTSYASMKSITCCARPLRHWLNEALCPEQGPAQTGLVFRASPGTVLRPMPHRDPRHVHLRTEASQTWPSPCHERLGSRLVNVSRLQASREVATRVLASSEEACDTPLRPPSSHSVPGVCYSALRRLPRRDLHPLEMNDAKQTLLGLLHHDAP